MIVSKVSRSSLISQCADRLSKSIMYGSESEEDLLKLIGRGATKILAIKGDYIHYEDVSSKSVDEVNRGLDGSSHQISARLYLLD